MNKKILKLSIVILIILIIQFCYSINIYAAGIGLSINKTSVTEGDTFTVTISGINGKVTISCNSNVSLSTSGTQWVEGSMTISGTAKSAGTGTITVTPINASTTSLDPEKVTSAASKSININAKAASTPSKKETQTTPKKDTSKKETKKEEEIKKSSNANLASLNIEGFSFTPEFNSNVQKYYLSINQDINNIKINANAEDSKAKVEISEHENLDFGITPITIKVIAEDGNKKEYIVEVNKQDTSLCLSSLSVSSETQNFELSPEFNKNITNFTLNTENVSNLDIKALANYEDATIDISGNSELKNGKNIITINVKKDDEIKTYTITVNNYKPSLIDKISESWSKLWIVFVVTLCSLVQSGIGIYYVIKYYNNSK